MYNLNQTKEPKKQEFNTANALLEKSTPAFDLTDDDYDFFKASEGATQLQNSIFSWQGSTQEKKGKDGINALTEYDTLVKNERSTLSQDMNDNQLSYFNKFADQHDSINRPWAQQYENEQRKTFGIDTQNAVLASNKATLAANLHDDNFVQDSIAQINLASHELAKLQGLAEEDSANLRTNNINDAIKAALQSQINNENVEEAAKLFRHNGHFLTTSSQEEIKNDIRSLHARMLNKKTIDDANDKLLQMDEDAATALLEDANWLNSMGISDEMLGNLKEVNAAQRQKILREEQKNLEQKRHDWYSKYLTAITDGLPNNLAIAIRLLQENDEIGPGIREDMLNAITYGRMDTTDDVDTLLSLQDDFLNTNILLNHNDALEEVAKGNLRISTVAKFAEIEKNLKKHEKQFIYNALTKLDENFSQLRDFNHSPARLAARKMLLNDLTAAFTQGDTAKATQLANPQHIEAVAKTFGWKEPTKDTPLTLGELQLKFPLQTKYIEGAFGLVGEAKNSIHAAAKAAGIPAISIAGAIVDESNRRIQKDGTGLLDTGQDFIAILKPSLEKVRKNFKNPDHDPGIIFPNRIQHDIGPGNFGIRTALPLFEKYILENKLDEDKDRSLTPEEKNLRQQMQKFLYKHVDKHASEQEKWEAYVNNMLLTTEGTAWLAAAEILRGKTKLEEHNALDGLSDLEKEAVLMTWYKQGDNYLVKYLDKTKKKKRPIQPGEGARLFHYYDKFKEILQ